MPGPVRALGVVSLLMDVATSIVQSVLPIFLVTTLGASVLAIGLLEAGAEAVGLALRAISGTRSDRSGRSRFLLAGYGVSAASLCLLALASGISTCLLARWAERAGKAIRAAPRDALVADLCPPDVLGAGFGLRRTLDTIGTLVGPLLASLILTTASGDLRAALFAAPPFALAAVFVLARTLRRVHTDGRVAERTATGGAERLGRPARVLIGILAVASFGRLGDAFLLLRSHDVGFAVTAVPLVLLTMRATSAAVPYPIGRLSDTIGRNGLFAASLVAPSLTSLALAYATGPAALLFGSALWGVQLGLASAVAHPLLADRVTPETRGRAFGWLGAWTGVGALVSNVGAAALWKAFGPREAFLTVACFPALALVAWLWLSRRS